MTHESPDRRGKERLPNPEVWRPTPDVARFLIGATVAPEFTYLNVTVTNANRDRIRAGLQRQKHINLRPVARDLLSIENHRAESGREAETLTRKEGEVRASINTKIAERRLPGGDINMAGLRDDLRAGKDEFPVNDPIYATLAQAILELPPSEKNRVIEQVLEEAEQGPTDRRMFGRLSNYVEFTDEQARAYHREQRIRMTGKRITRRGVLQASGVFVAAASAAALGLYSTRGGSPEPEPTPTPEPGELKQFKDPFAGPEANKIANELGITAGSFWEPDAQVMATIGNHAAFLYEKTVLPIFPAAVADQQKAIEWAANNTESQIPTQIPVNVLATVATIESAGKTDASSDADAYGLTQVVPGYHLDTIVQAAKEISGKVINGEKMPFIDVSESEATLEQWQKLNQSGQSTQALTLGNSLPDAADALKNPYVALKTGAWILQQNYQEALKEQKTPPLTSAVDTWVVALGEYNGGSGILNETVAKEPTQTQLYQMYGKRFFMTATIAALLRNGGMGDPEVARELISAETDARAYAYQNIVDNPQGAYAPLLANMGKSMRGYNILWPALSQPEITVDPNTGLNHALGVTREAATQLTDALRNAYNNYPANKYKEPLSPGLRMWINHGGYGLFSSVPVNMDPHNYPANQH